MQSVFLTVTISCLVLFWLAVQHKLSVIIYMGIYHIICSNCRILRTISRFFRLNLIMNSDNNPLLL